MGICEVIKKTRDSSVCPGSQLWRKRLHVRNKDCMIKLLIGEFRWMSTAQKTDPEEETCFVTDSSKDDNRENSGTDTYSDMISSTDTDRYLVPSETVFDNAADDLETIAVSKRWKSL